METPNIVITRIDQRLIHGQAGAMLKQIDCNLVIVVNDAASENKMEQELMKTTVPQGIESRFFSVKTMIDVIHKAAARQKIAIIVGCVKDLYELIVNNVPIKEVNVGNIHPGEGREKINKNISLSLDEKKMLAELVVKYNVKLNTNAAAVYLQDSSSNLDLYKVIGVKEG